VDLETGLHLAASLEPDIAMKITGQPATAELPNAARQGLNGFGASGYGGPLPREGTHPPSTCDRLDGGAATKLGLVKERRQEENIREAQGGLSYRLNSRTSSVHGRQFRTDVFSRPARRA
jgi:hypothetical protein